MKKSIIAIIIALNMLLCTGYKAYASGEVAAALAVAGGSIGTAGLAVGSIPALPIAAGLAAGALIAVGINIALTDASKQEGMTKSQFMQAKLEEWGTAAGKTKDQIADAILSGATVARDGTIYLGREAGKLLNQFGNWLWGSGQVTTPVASDGSIVIQGLSLPKLHEIYVEYSGVGAGFKYSTDVYIVRIGTKYNASLPAGLYALSSSTFQTVANMPDYARKLDDMNIYTIVKTDRIYSSTKYYADLAHTVPVTVPYYSGNIYRFLAGITDLPLTGTGSIDDGFVGDEEDWQAKGDVLLPADGEAIALSPGLLGTIADQIGDIVKDGTIAVKDYVDAVIDAVNDLPIDIPVTDDKTGVIEIPQIPAIPYEDTASIEDVPDTDVPTDKDPIVDPTIPVVPDGGGVDALGSLTLDLKSVFPFCLPFDAVDMIRLLNVPAEAPFYHVHVPIPAVNQSVDFDIDLSPFDSVAAVARKMEIILFCVGLALATRQIIRS